MKGTGVGLSTHGGCWASFLCEGTTVIETMQIDLEELGTPNALVGVELDWRTKQPRPKPPKFALREITEDILDELCN